MRFLYSAKANPHPSVLRCIFDEGFGLDAASMGEVSMGVKLGLAPEDIYYSAPGKSMNDLDAALEKCVIIADSAAELERIQYLAARHGVKPDYRQIARSRRLMEAQLRAYIGRNTPLEDNGFYANIYPVDAVITASIELLDEPATDQPADHD